jgi:anti-sigma-K factor RskA
VAVAAALLNAGFAIGVGAGELGSPSERTVTAKVSDTSGASIQLDVNGEEGRLLARDLAAPPNGRVYQVWLKRDGHAPEPTAALFTPSRDGAATASVPGSLEGVDQVMVTDEPAGGSPQPTGDLLAVADLSS